MRLALAETIHQSSFRKTTVDMKQKKKVFIQAAEQISIQQPLSQEWMKDPIYYASSLVHALAPSFRDYISPGELRRMSNIMRRALVTSLKVLKDTGTEKPDAIITATSLGNQEYNEKLLNALTDFDEEMLSPTHFMQSTHNTVSSALAISTKTNGYNTTYSHGCVSFDLTVFDAWMQMQLGKISNALIGGHDEMIESYFELLKKIEYVGKEGMVPCGEVAMSMMLNTKPSTDSLCELVGIRICHRPSNEVLRYHLNMLLEETGMNIDDISAVMTGKNGNPSNDKYYIEICDLLFPNTPLLHYKHIFGENYSSSALGLYAAAHCLKQNIIPSHVYDQTRVNKCKEVQSILLLNQMDGEEYSLILIKK